LNDLAQANEIKGIERQGRSNFFSGSASATSQIGGIFAAAG
jgi:hypothetical protein